MDPKSLEGTSGGNNGGLTAVVKTIAKIQRDDKASGNDRLSRLTASDNTSVPFKPTLSEQAALMAELRALAKQKENSAVEECDDFLLKAALHARKGSVERGYALATNYVDWRRKVSYADNMPMRSTALGDILRAGLFVPAGNTSRDGRPVLTVRYRFFNPRRFSALDTARAFGVVVEWMLRTYPAALTHGVVVVEDVAGFSFRNFDLRLISFLEKAFTSILPVRIAALYVMNPGWVIRSMFALFAGFFSDKLKARIRLFGKGEEDKFGEVFEKDQIPEFLNLEGTMEWTPEMQDEVVQRMVMDSSKWEASSTEQAAAS